MPYIGKPQSADPITVNASNIEDGSILAADISSSFGDAISGSFTTVSSSFSTRVSDVEAGSTSKTLVSSSAQIADDISGSLSNTAIANLEAGIVSGSSQLATDISGSFGNQRVGTSDSPTFAGGTITGDFAVGGTLTAQEVHTEFESASILFTSGSTIFGNSSDDVHNMTGSLNISGSLFVKDGTLTVTDNVDFNGDLDVDGTTNLDNTDIDGTLTVDGGNIVFNEDSADQDFRVESNGNANMLVVDGGNNRVGIGVSPASTLDVTSGELANTVNLNSTNGATNITLKSNGSLIGQMEFSSAGPSQIVTRTTASLALGVNNNQYWTIKNDGTLNSSNSALHITTNGTDDGDYNGAVLSRGVLNLNRDDTATVKQIKFHKNGSEHSSIETTSDGLNISGSKVGIGTRVPDTKLDVNGVITGRGSDYIIKAVSTSTSNSDAARVSAETGIAQGKIEIDFFNDDSRPGGGYGLLQVGKTANTPEFSIMAAAVGIGTNNPTGKLQIRTTSYGSVDEALTLDTSQTSVGSGTMISFTGNNRGFVGANIKGQIQASSQEKTSLIFEVNNGSAINELFRLDYSGLVGIGTNNPAAELDVQNSSEARFRVRRGSIYTELAQNSSGGVLTMDKANGDAGIQFVSYGTSFIGRDSVNNKLGIGTTSPIGRVHIHNAGDGSGGVQSGGDEDTLVVSSSMRHFTAQFDNAAGNYDSAVIGANTPGRSGSTAFKFFRATDNSEEKTNIRGDGSIQARNTTLQAFDYAEFFEVALTEHTASGIPAGVTVALTGSKVIPASQSNEEPIGIVRPRNAPAIIGNSPWNHWHAKYKTTDYGEPILDENQSPVVNPSFVSQSYTPREDRNEWVIIGLLGQIPITNGQPTGSSWRKMHNISPTASMWFVK